MHSEVRDNLEAYLDGSLMPIKRMEVEAHLRSCEGCRKEIEEAKLTDEWVKALVTELVMPAPGFYARVRARVQAEGRQVWPFWQMVPTFGRQLGYAVAMTLLVATGYLFSIRLTEDRSVLEALMLEAPAIHSEAPLFKSGEVHANRERVMVALIAPLTNVDAD